MLQNVNRGLTAPPIDDGIASCGDLLGFCQRLGLFDEGCSGDHGVVEGKGKLLLGLAVAVVGADDALDEVVADDVDVFEVAETDAFDAIEDVEGFEEAGLLGVGQVDLGEVAGDDGLGVSPRRVTNIFICSLVVFWASSMMMKASLRVRPRMKASGATSMTLDSRSLSTFWGSRRS